MSNKIAGSAGAGVHGWIILDKPLGLSSSDGVGVIKRLARRAGWGKVKVGHGGTLDPLATGVLPIALGEATKLTGRMLDADKEYIFELTFGAATATDDAEGAVVAVSAVRPTRAALEAVLPRFTGPIRQRPPAYSALKVDGQRAYALARAGEVVELAEREVVIRGLEMLSGPPPGAGEGLEWVTLRVCCSKGTYVRSLARDIALALGTVGHVTLLRRTRAGPFGIGQALAVDKLEALCDGARLEAALLPLTAGLDGIPAIAVSALDAAALREGRPLPPRPGFLGLGLVTSGGVPVALVRGDETALRVERGFNLPQPDAAE